MRIRILNWCEEEGRGFVLDAEGEAEGTSVNK